MATLISTAAVHPHCAAPARVSLIGLLGRAVALHRSRRALASLSAAQLSDIGISAQEAAREARRPIWDAPGHWYC